MSDPSSDPTIPTIGNPEDQTPPPAPLPPSPEEARRIARQAVIEGGKKAMLDSLPDGVSQENRDRVAALIDQGMGGYFNVSVNPAEPHDFKITRREIAEVGDIVLVRDSEGDIPAIVTKVYGLEETPFDTYVDVNVFLNGVDRTDQLQEMRARSTGNTWVALKAILPGSVHPAIDDENAEIALIKEADEAKENALINFLATLVRNESTQCGKGIMMMGRGLLAIINEIGKHHGMEPKTINDVRALAIRSYEHKHAAKTAAQAEPTPATPAS